MLISEFARLGQVSVRMLRHYDAVGLLGPDRLDPATGYGRYLPEQLPALNRIVALKDLGFTLEQVARLLDDDMDIAELRGMLRLRRAELTEQTRAAQARLTAVETRLRMIEQEEQMPPDYVVKTVPAMRLIGRTATLEPEQLGQAVESMFDAVAASLGHLDGALATPLATYAETETGMDVVVGFAWRGPAPDGTEVIELEQARAVCGVHLGPMVGVQSSWQALHRWVVDNGYGFAGPCREMYVRADAADQGEWVTELQQPIR